MAQLLIDWMNIDLVLSRKVASFADDFKDGYLLGEILYLYNQQENFAEFSAHGNPSAKLNNFCMLEPTMRKINVTFNSRIVTAIMHGKEKVTKNLLYEMKTQLERIFRSSKQTAKPDARGETSDKVLNVIKPTRPAYDKAVSATFDNAIRGKVENAKKLMMDNATMRFTDREAQYVYNMSMADEDLYEATMNTHMRTKDIGVSRKEHEGEFAEAWDSINLEQWKRNQRIARDRRNLKKRVEMEQSYRSDKKKLSYLHATRKGTMGSINKFEESLEANILAAGSAANEDTIGAANSMIKTATATVAGKGGKPNQTVELMYIDNNILREGFEGSTQRIKEHHEDGAVRQHVHDQRRRKFLREYDTMQIKMSQKIFQSVVIAQMLNFAGIENAENAEMDKVVSYKKIITDNRSNRQQLMDDMAANNERRSFTWNHVTAQREVQWIIKGDLAAQQKRSAMLLDAQTIAYKQQNIDFASDLVDKLLDVVDFVVSCRSVGVFYYDTNALPGAMGRRGLMVAAAEDMAAAAASAAAAQSTADGGGGDAAAEANGEAAAKSRPHSGAGAAAQKSARGKTPPTSSAEAGGVDAAAANAPPSGSCDDTGGLLPPELWKDAVAMFKAAEPLAKEIAIPEPLLVTTALWPFSVSEQPHCVNVDWLFSKPFETDDLLHDLPPPPPRVDAANVTVNGAAPVAADVGADAGVGGASANDEASLLSGSVTGHINALEKDQTQQQVTKEGAETEVEVLDPAAEAAKLQLEAEAKQGRPAGRLATIDTSTFIETLNTADIAEGKLPVPETVDSTIVADGIAAVDAQEPAPPTDTAADATATGDGGSAEAAVAGKDRYFTPPWLFDTNPQHVLGEAIIAVRCAVEPVPSEPNPLVPTAHIPLRAALCGTSDLARQQLASALQKQIPGLVVIEAAALVHKAYEHQMQVQVAAVASDLARRPSDVSGLDFEPAEMMISPLKSPEVGLNEVRESESPLLDPIPAPVVTTDADDPAAAAAANASAAGDPAAAGSVPSCVDEDADSDAPPPVEVEDFAATYEELSKAVVAQLLQGAVVSDTLYVQLILHKIKQIPERNNGFVLQDFPNTKEQALLLMESLSGIAFDSHRPQPEDKSSMYAPFREKEPTKWDVAKCGLDVIVHLNNGPDSVASAFLERARARKDPIADSTKGDATDGAAEVTDPAEGSTPVELPVIVEGEEAADSAAATATTENQTAAAEKVVYISDQQSSVVGLTKLSDHERPYYSSGIDLTVADLALKELLTLCTELQLLDAVTVPPVTELSEMERVAALKAEELCTKFIPENNLKPEYLSPPVPAEQEGEVEGNSDGEQPNEDGDAAAVVVDGDDVLGATADEAGADAAEITAADGAADAAADTPAETAATAATADEGTAAAVVESPAAAAVDADGNPIPSDDTAADALPASEEEAKEPEEPYIYEMPEVINTDNVIPTRLAQALLDMWNTTEQQSQRKANTFFSSMRDIRYQMVQRRRAAFDCVSSMLVRLDNRQELFDAFREKFNAVPSDMRFDPDCIAELHLQTLELCDKLTEQSELRKSEGDNYASKVAADGVMKVFQHRCRCEAVAMIQSEFQRFFVALHVIFDYTKSVQGYQLHEKILNELEEALPVTWPEENSGAAAAGGKKDKSGKEANKSGRAGKDAKPTHTPFREPLGPVLVPAGSMKEGLPVVNGEPEVAVDPKAKAKKDNKKGAPTETDPFTEIETGVCKELEKWKKGVFEASRVLYDEDEALCAAVERAVWYEAEKALLGVANIKAMMLSQVSWLEVAEQEMNRVISDMISKRHIKELSAINFLVEMIEQNIEEAQEVKELWLVSPDSAPVDPTTVWADFHELLTPELLAELGTNAADGTIDPTLLALVGLGLNSAQIAALATAGKKLDVDVLTAIGKIGKNFTPKELTKLAKLAKGITSSQLALFAGGDITPEQLITLLSTIHAAEEAEKGNADGHFVPEHTKGARKQNASNAHRKGSSLSEKLASRTRVAAHRPAMVVTGVAAGVSMLGGSADDPFHREQQKFQMMRRKFEEKLQKRRHAREIEFKNMGMSPATAKLAAYNEMFLEEQHELEDFDSRHKPKLKTPSSFRRGNVTSKGGSGMSLTKAQQAALAAKAGSSSNKKTTKHHHHHHHKGAKKGKAGGGGSSGNNSAGGSSSSSGSTRKRKMSKVKEARNEEMSPRQATPPSRKK